MMKKTIVFALVFLFVPVVLPFSGSNSNYKTTANIGLGLVEEQNNSNYNTKAVMVNQPIGIYQSSNNSLYLGPYYLFGKDGIKLFYLFLTPNWNLVSIPLIPTDNSITAIMSNCSYDEIWKFNPDQTWTTTDTGLTEMDIYNGYWVDRTSLTNNCTLTIKGKLPSSTTLNIIDTWILVGYPSLTSKQISTFINPSLYNRIWEFQQDQSWINIDTGLTNMTSGKGYWIEGIDNGSYDVTN